MLSQQQVADFNQLVGMGISHADALAHVGAGVASPPMAGTVQQATGVQPTPAPVIGAQVAPVTLPTARAGGYVTSVSRAPGSVGVPMATADDESTWTYERIVATRARANNLPASAPRGEALERIAQAIGFGVTTEPKEWDAYTKYRIQAAALLHRARTSGAPVDVSIAKRLVDGNLQAAGPSRVLAESVWVRIQERAGLTKLPVVIPPAGVPASANHVVPEATATQAQPSAPDLGGSPAQPVKPATVAWRDMPADQRRDTQRYKSKVAKHAKLMANLPAVKAYRASVWTQITAERKRLREAGMTKAQVSAAVKPMRDDYGVWRGVTEGLCACANLGSPQQASQCAVASTDELGQVILD